MAIGDSYINIIAQATFGLGTYTSGPVVNYGSLDSAIAQEMNAADVILPAGGAPTLVYNQGSGYFQTTRGPILLCIVDKTGLGFDLVQYTSGGIAQYLPVAPGGLSFITLRADLTAPVTQGSIYARTPKGGATECVVQRVMFGKTLSD